MLFMLVFATIKIKLKLKWLNFASEMNFLFSLILNGLIYCIMFIFINVYYMSGYNNLF